MRSSEQVAFEMYGQLEVRDRHLVDAWRELGNDWCTSLLNSGVLIRQGPRTHPATAKQQEATAKQQEAWEEAWEGFLRRRMPPGPDQVLRRAAEHEAAHAVVAEALGLKVFEISVGEDGSGSCLFKTGTTAETAAVRVAGSMWVDEFRSADHPYGDTCGGNIDRRWLAANVDDFGLHAAKVTARRLLKEHHARVVELATIVERHRHFVLEEV